mgnify:FL=1|tara:strand:- start:7568 stop:8707 length:1140 start_codon:yes stop_codon:yes gene_type:complete
MSRLLDSHSLLRSHRLYAKDLPLDISSHIEHGRAVINQQIPRWKDNHAHQEVLNKLTNLQIAHDEYNLAVNNLQHNIDSVISNKERKILQRDYARYYDSELKHDDVLEIIARQKYISNEFDDQINGVIQQFISWQYPSLEINPADGRYSSLMNASDPQYAICTTKEVKQLLRSKFNKFYSTRRLRTYNKIKHIPINQIGFATCINMFEYMPLDPIKDITKQVFNCLRPGGMFLLSYNNCDHRQSLDLLNSDFRCLNTKKIMESLLYGQGFNIVSSDDSNGVWTWLLVTKPGERSTQKLSTAKIPIVEKFYTWDEFPIEIQKWVMSHKANTQEEWMRTLARDFDNQWERAAVDWSHLGTSGDNVWKKYNNSIRIYIASTF